MSDPRKWSVGRRTREELEADIALYDVTKTFYALFKQLKTKIPAFKMTSWSLADRLAQPSTETCTVPCSVNRRRKQQSDEIQEALKDFQEKMKAINGLEDMGDDACKVFEKIEVYLKDIYGISEEF